MQHKRHNDVFEYVPTIDIENESMQYISVELSSEYFGVLDCSGKGIAKAVVVSSVAWLKDGCEQLHSGCIVADEWLMNDCLVAVRKGRDL